MPEGIGVFYSIHANRPHALSSQPDLRGAKWFG